MEVYEFIIRTEDNTTPDLKIQIPTNKIACVPFLADMMKNGENVFIISDDEKNKYAFQPHERIHLYYALHYIKSNLDKNSYDVANRHIKRNTILEAMPTSIRNFLLKPYTLTEEDKENYKGDLSQVGALQNASALLVCLGKFRLDPSNIMTKKDPKYKPPLFPAMLQLCNYIAKTLLEVQKGKSVNEASEICRKIFTLVNDFTPEEEIKIQKEIKWIEESLINYTKNVKSPGKSPGKSPVESQLHVSTLEDTKLEKKHIIPNTVQQENASKNLSGAGNISVGSSKTDTPISQKGAGSGVGRGQNKGGPIELEAIGASKGIIDTSMPIATSGTHDDDILKEYETGGGGGGRIKVDPIEHETIGVNQWKRPGEESIDDDDMNKHEHMFSQQDNNIEDDSF